MTARLKMSVSALPSGDAEAEAAPRESAKIAQYRVLLERLDQEIATLKVYTELLEVPSKRSATASLSASDLAATAPARINVFSMLDEKQSQAASVESRMRDSIPPQPVVISTTTLPLSPRPAIFGGIFAAFTVSALLAVRRKSPTWA